MKLNNVEIGDHIEDENGNTRTIETFLYDDYGRITGVVFEELALSEAVEPTPVLDGFTPA